jgi:two-component sensor histidine kinase
LDGHCDANQGVQIGEVGASADEYRGGPPVHGDITPISAEGLWSRVHRYTTLSGETLGYVEATDPAIVERGRDRLPRIDVIVRSERTDRVHALAQIKQQRAPQWRLVFWLLVAILCRSGFAIDRDIRLNQLAHTAWTTKDGIPANVFAFAQTSDGALWIGSSDGLFRFDGIRFMRFRPSSGPDLPDGSIHSLLADPDGSLWVGFAPDGISHIKDGVVLATYTSKDGLPRERTRQILRDRRGSIWALNSTGLARLEGARWIAIGSSWNLTEPFYLSAYFDRKGNLWVGTLDKVFALVDGGHKFQLVADHVGRAYDFAESPEGTMWLADGGRSVHPIALEPNKSMKALSEVRVGADKVRFQGLVLQFQLAANATPAGERSRTMMEQTLQRADLVLSEGRDRVLDLRSTAEEGRNLPELVAKIGTELSTQFDGNFFVEVHGQSRPLNSLVRDEFYAIAREALTNSFRHAQASEIVCEIEFARNQFRLTCRDNGIGIPTEFLNKSGREGHWGLVGMRERAEKIGARASLSRDSTKGTTAEFTLDARIAYASPGKQRWWNLFENRLM